MDAHGVAMLFHMNTHISYYQYYISYCHTTLVALVDTVAAFFSGCGDVSAGLSVPSWYLKVT